MSFICNIHNYTEYNQQSNVFSAFNPSKCTHTWSSGQPTPRCPGELIRLLIVACGMLVHSSSMALRSCWILAGTGTRCHIRRSRASQTCSMGDMSSEYAGHAKTGMFSASRNCVQILATLGRALLCCNIRG